MSCGASASEVEPRWIYPTILTINPMKNGKEVGHGSSSNKVGADGGVTFLLGNLFLHQTGILFLLFNGAVLRPQ